MIHPAMHVFLNGQFIPEEQATVSVFDRGFLFGDGLFETLRVCNGKPFRWHRHWERLARGADFLKISLSAGSESLRASADELVAMNQMPEALLRVTLSRGVGARGYSPRDATRPTLVMSLHETPPIDLQNPPRWRLITSSLRLPANEPLSQFKTGNKLPQILARIEADGASADEALLVNTDGHVVEAASGNLFWIESGTVCTPPLESGILPGVTRETVLELCRYMAVPTCEKNAHGDALCSASGVFFSLSSLGIVEGASLDGQALGSSPLAERVRNAYWELVRSECRSNAN
jgi:branched-chain amino acid aminotransferase